MLCNTQERSLIKVKNVQMQRGSNDCGVFAIAFVTAICCGFDPSDLYFQQDAMRAHLFKCLQDQYITPFPILKRQTRRLVVLQALELEIFCWCRLPDEGTMVECSTCLRWFHFHCVKPSEKITEGSWYCRDCN